MLRIRKNFAGDRRGVASIEFAFIVPILITMYFGVVELSLAIEASRKVTSTASAIGDLIAQTKQVNNAEVEAVFNVADAVMQPLDDAPLQIRVTSVSMDEDGDIAVNWGRSRNTTATACGATVTVPEAVLAEGQSVIIAEVVYNYEPPLGRVLLGTIRMDEVFYMRPRESVEVTMLPTECP